ncbi:MAG: cohesin domain-containing protein [Candidatus Saccharimonadales bacterium]
MKNIYKASLVALTTVLAVVVLSALPNANASGTATLSLSPNSGTYAKGASFTVTVNEDSGSSTINAVQADLSYDQSKLQFISLNDNPPASAFGISAAASGGSGNVTFQMGNITPLSGSHPVGTVTFKTLVDGPGSTSVSFDDTSKILTNDSTPVDVWNHSPTGATYSLKAPATSGGGGSGSGSTTTKKTTTSTTQSTAPSTISPSPTQQQSDPTAPVPASSDSSTSGSYLVAIKVVDNKGHVVSAATVTLGSTQAKTDTTGVASFSGITAGVYKVAVKTGSLKGNSTITVDGTQPTSSVQQFEVKAKPLYNWPLYIGVGAAIVVLLIILAIWRGGRMPKLKDGGSSFTSDMPTPTVVTADGGPSTPAPAPSITTPQTTAPTATKGDDNVLKPTVIAPASGGTVITPNNPPASKA